MLGWVVYAPLTKNIFESVFNYLAFIYFSYNIFYHYSIAFDISFEFTFCYSYLFLICLPVYSFHNFFPLSFWREDLLKSKYNDI